MKTLFITLLFLGFSFGSYALENDKNTDKKEEVEKEKEESVGLGIKYAYTQVMGIDKVKDSSDINKRRIRNKLRRKNFFQSNNGPTNGSFTNGGLFDGTGSVAFRPNSFQMNSVQFVNPSSGKVGEGPGGASKAAPAFGGSTK